MALWVVPFAEIDRVLSALERIKLLETARDKEVANGLKVFPAIEQLLDSDEVRYVD